MTFTTYVPRAVDDTALELLAGVGEVVRGFGDSAVSFDSVADRIDAILLRTATVTGEQIDAAPRLRIIARHGVGTDSVDVDAATRRGIPVTITAQANSTSVAEHVFALLLAVTRRVAEANDGVRALGWAQTRAELVGSELSGSTLGILGFGRIGQRVARIAQGFGMNVIANDPIADEAVFAGAGAVRVSFDDLLQRSDVLSIHLPLTGSTRGLIGDSAMSSMPAGAVIINTARGGIVDEAALVAHIAAGHLGGAGLDVVEHEPLPADSALLGQPRIVVTPHLGGQTTQAMRRVATEAAQAIIDVAQGKIPQTIVNPN